MAETSGSCAIPNQRLVAYNFAPIRNVPMEMPCKHMGNDNYMFKSFNNQDVNSKINYLA